jgi:hypothetical protein
MICTFWHIYMCCCGILAIVFALRCSLILSLISILVGLFLSNVGMELVVVDLVLYTLEVGVFVIGLSIVAVLMGWLLYVGLSCSPLDLVPSCLVLTLVEALLLGQRLLILVLVLSSLLVMGVSRVCCLGCCQDFLSALICSNRFTLSSPLVPVLGH